MPGCDSAGQGCLPRTLSLEWQECHSLCYKSANCKTYPETVCKVEKLHIVSVQHKNSRNKASALLYNAITAT